MAASKVDLAMIQRIAPMYREQTHEITARLTTALSEEKNEAFREALHELQGMNAVIGFEAVVELCERLRELFMAKKLVEAQTAIGEISNVSIETLEKHLSTQE